MGKSSQLPLQLGLLALAFFYLLISSSAVPATRSGGLMVGIPRADLHLLQGPNLMKKEKGRMAVEVDDYPGSGANNRHTPRPFSRGCSDC